MKNTTHTALRETHFAKVLGSRLRFATAAQGDFLKMYFAACFVVLFFLIASSAHAATLTFSLAEPTLVVGQPVSMVISADAGDEKISTVKTVLAYPQDLLEPVSFVFASTTIPLAQPGYDQMKDGVMIKTAGFPGGFTGMREFGTVMFKAKRAGAAIVSVSNESLLLNAQSVNRLSGESSATITIAAPAPITPVIEKTPEAKRAPEVGAHGVPSTRAPSLPVFATSSESAVVASSNLPLRPALIVSLLVVALLGGFVWKISQKS